MDFKVLIQVVFVFNQMKQFVVHSIPKCYCCVWIVLKFAMKY